jgi:endonuclease YncB( thermonuclease family)
VIDGDTFEARVGIWPDLQAVVSVRIRGWDAPEYHRPACEAERMQGALARAQLEELLPENQRVELTNVSADAFSGRVLAEVDRVAEERSFSLAVLLERRGAVVPWEDGASRDAWCGD